MALNDGLVDDGVFGTESQEASDDTESTHNGDTLFVQKLRMTAPSLPSGTYRIGWSYELQGEDKDGKGAKAQVKINDATTIHSIQGAWDNMGASGEWAQNGGFYYHTGSGVLNIDIDYGTMDAAKTAKIRRARLEIWRVS